MIERVIVGVDFSEGSRAALLEGERLAEQFGVPCLAVHVLPSTVPVFPEVLPIQLDPVWYQEEDRLSRVQLQNWISPLPNVLPKVVTGEPSRRLVETAGPNALLVVGHEHHSSLASFFFGSTTRRVLDHAPCPVLVVPAPPVSSGN